MDFLCSFKIFVFRRVSFVNLSDTVPQLSHKNSDSTQGENNMQALIESLENVLIESRLPVSSPQVLKTRHAVSIATKPASSTKVCLFNCLIWCDK